jgi:uncharacterized protein
MHEDWAIEKLLLKILTLLVDEPQELRVTSEPAVRGTILHVKVARNDVGKVIGRDGRTARSLRVLLSAMAVTRKTQYGLNIIQPN